VLLRAFISTAHRIEIVLNKLSAFISYRRDARILKSSPPTISTLPRRSSQFLAVRTTTRRLLRLGMAHMLQLALLKPYARVPPTSRTIFKLATPEAEKRLQAF